MSRLTDTINGVNVLILNNYNGGKYDIKQFPDNTYSIQGDAVDKLAEYEKLEEQ